MTSLGIAEELAKKHKEISVAEFFERNKHILGFDSPTKALLTAVKEGVDNALDACEEAGILPDIHVEIRKGKRNEFKVVIEDNGPGIIKKQVPHVFGRLLYGSRFHAIRQSRGQQGIGISAAVMYGQLTTGRASTIKSKTARMDTAVTMQLMIDTKKNRSEVLKEDFFVWDGKEHGVRIEMFMEGRYVRSKQSPLEYLRGTAIVNPHASITFIEPDGLKHVFERVSEKLPDPTEEIKPHPTGIELGIFMRMLKSTDKLKVRTFLQTEFESVSYRVADEILAKAKLDRTIRVKDIDLDRGRAILDAISKVRIQAPSKECLSPIGDILIRKGLRNVLDGAKPDFYSPPITREPRVYKGNPFQVEVGIVYGGQLPREHQVQVLRFANRVPLLYQQGGCAITQAVEGMDWRRYGLDQKGGRGIPHGPAVIMVHIASTKVPFTSESKEAVANIAEIIEEVQKGLRACARRLQTHLNKKVRKKKAREKFDIVQQILPMIAEKSSELVGKPVPALGPVITQIMNVIWIDDTVEYQKKRHKITLTLYNYTPTGKKLSLYAEVPANCIDDKSFSLAPTRMRSSGKIRWDLGRIKTTEKLDITFDLKGLDKRDFDECELYVSGITAANVIGAEALPGDWDIDGEEPELAEIDPEVASAVASTELDDIPVEPEEKDEDTHPIEKEKARPDMDVIPMEEKRVKPDKNTLPKEEKKAKPDKDTAPKGEKKAKPERDTLPMGDKKARPERDTIPKEEKKVRPDKDTPRIDKRKASPDKSPPPPKKQIKSTRDKPPKKHVQSKLEGLM